MKKNIFDKRIIDYKVHGGKMTVKAIIPIKTNNERLPGKNTRILGDRPLIHYIQTALLKADHIDSISVFCSNEAIREFLLDGVEFVKRPEQLDLPTSNFTQIFECFMKNNDADVYVYAHATAPFISTEIINDCVNAVLNGKYDSAFCARKIQDFLWKNGTPLNFDAQNVPRSQDIEPIYRETSGVYVYTKEVFQKFHRRIGNIPYIKELTLREAIDINGYEDFKFAEIMLNQCNI